MNLGKSVLGCVYDQRDTLAFQSFCKRKDASECRGCSCYKLWNEGITGKTYLVGGMPVILAEETLC